MSRFDAVMPFGAIGAERRWFRAGPFVCSLLVAAVLITASIGKLMSPELSTTSKLVVGGQFAVSLFIAAFHSRRIAWALVALMFGAFAGYAGQRLYAGLDCGCFGNVEPFKSIFKPRVTLAIDLFAIALSLGLATATSLRGLLVPITALITGVLTTSSVGLAFAATHSPEVYKAPAGVDKDDPVLTLMSLPLMEDIRTARPADPAWLVFIYNPECHICQEHLPIFTEYAQRNPRDKVMRVRAISMADLEKLEQNAIPAWAWRETPTTVLFQGGVEVKRFGKDDVPTPVDVRRGLKGNENKGQEAVDKLLAQPEMQDVVASTATGSPRWLVYLYNPECPKCLDHLVTFEAFEKQAPPDADMRVRMLSMDRLEKSMGVKIYEWPSVPTTLLIQGGKVVRLYKSEETPDPFDVWAGK